MIEKNNKDKQLFELEMKELRRIIDYNKQLKDFMDTKSDTRYVWKAKIEKRRAEFGEFFYSSTKVRYI